MRKKIKLLKKETKDEKYTIKTKIKTDNNHK